MTYIVEVEKNYKIFQNCLIPLTIQRSRIYHNPTDYYLELARKIEEKYNIKCHLTKMDNTLVWQYLEFESEQDYLVWVLKFG